MVDIQKENQSFFDKNLDNNDDAIALRKLYNIIEENQRIKKKTLNNTNNFNKKLMLKNSNLNDIIGNINNNNRPKNKYKLKLKSILLKKKIN